MSEESKEFKVIDSQEAFDNAIKSRLERNTKTVTESITKEFNEKYSGWISPDDAKNYADQIDTLTKNAEADKQTIEGLNAKIASYEKYNAKLNIAKSVGLPIDLADRISGDDEDAMKADAEKLLTYIKPNHVPREYQAEQSNAMSGVEKAFLAKNPGLVL